MCLQLEKVYDPKNEEDDMMEMEEERLRMREHVMKNVSLFWLSLLSRGSSLFFLTRLLSPSWKVDTNKDRLVSLDEFLRSTEKKEFTNPREWEVRRSGGHRGEGAGGPGGGLPLGLTSAPRCLLRLWMPGPPTQRRSSSALRRSSRTRRRS